MELEHACQQPAFMAALQVFVAGVLLAPAMTGGDLHRRFVAAAASYVVSFGPIAILVYVLCRVSYQR